MEEWWGSAGREEKGEWDEVWNMGLVFYGEGKMGDLRMGVILDMGEYGKRKLKK